MIEKTWPLFVFILIEVSVPLFFSSCKSEPPVSETPINIVANGSQVETKSTGTGLSAEIRMLVELGSPSSLQRALDIIRSRDLDNSDYGRAMGAAAIIIIKKLYPDNAINLPLADPPQMHNYARIIRDLEREAYTPPLSTSTDYLEYVLPFLAFLNPATPLGRLDSALLDLENATKFSSTSVLDPLFRAIIYDRQGQKERAMELYRQALSRAQDCYPASIGLAQLYIGRKEYQAALDIYADLSVRFPDQLLIKKELAKIWFELRQWDRATSAITEVLQRDPKDITFLLLRATSLIEQGFAIQAQPSLDAVATIEPGNARYLYLRARVQAEGFRNSDSAINYLRALLRQHPENLEATSYLAKLLLESGKAENMREGRQLLGVLVEKEGSSIISIELALKDAVMRQDWLAAEKLVARLLEQRSDTEDLKIAWQVRVGLKKYREASEIARELLQKEPNSPSIQLIYIESLVNSGQKAEALTFLQEKLKTVTEPEIKSSFYFLRSSLQTDTEAMLGDLRSSLFEDPRNIKSLIAMFEYYHAKKDERRAVYYLKQAISISPDDARLKQMQGQYSNYF